MNFTLWVYKKVKGLRTSLKFVLVLTYFEILGQWVVRLVVSVVWLSKSTKMNAMTVVELSAWLRVTRFHVSIVSILARDSIDWFEGFRFRWILSRVVCVMSRVLVGVHLGDVCIVLGSRGHCSGQQLLILVQPIRGIKMMKVKKDFLFKDIYL